MKKVRIAFFQIPKPFWARMNYCRKHPVAGGIAFVTGSRLVHVEAWTQTPWWYVNGHCRSDSELWLNGKCWTSTLRGDDGENGACWRPAAKVLHNPERWQFKEYTCSDEDYESMILAMEHAVATNKGYDFGLIAKMFFGWKSAVCPKKLICSEFVQMALLACHIIIERIKPNMTMWHWADDNLNLDKKALNPKQLAEALPGPMIQLQKG